MLQKSSESKPHIHERRSEKVSTVWWTKSTFLGFLMFAALETTPKSSERQVVFWIQGGKHQKHRGGATLGTDPTRKLPSEKVWNIASLLDNSLKANHRWCQLKVDLHFYKSHHLPFHTLWYIFAALHYSRSFASWDANRTVDRSSSKKTLCAVVVFWSVQGQVAAEFHARFYHVLSWQGSHFQSHACWSISGALIRAQMASPGFTHVSWLSDDKMCWLRIEL